MALGNALLLLCSTFCTYILGLIIYNIYLHPLSKFPGPKLWTAARLRWSRAFIYGIAHQEIRDLHERYGNVVRVAPDEISFIDPLAWNDIYNHANSRKFIKDPKAYIRSHDSVVDHILIANDVDHARIRRLLSHAFSEKALREQTKLVTGYVDLMIQRLKERTGQKLDLVKWYNYATFDIIGDLAFGSDFGCLASSDYHPWVSIIFGAIKSAGQLGIIRRYVPIRMIIAFLPAWAIQKRKDHEAMTISKVQQRLARTTDRADFLSYILRYNSSDAKGLSEGELIANSNLLILAGSETTATALSGVTYLLLRNPDVLRKLTNEVRSLYESEAQMTLQALANCSYLNAVLKEGLRMYPPVALGLPRVVVDDQVVIAGHVVPKETTVSVANWASHYSASNFSNPNVFDPSRWETTDVSDACEDDLNTVHQVQAYNPFSIGPRNCIGQNLAWMELRLILARMLWNFDLELLDDAFEPERQEVYVLWSKPALNIRVTSRSP